MRRARRSKDWTPRPRSRASRSFMPALRPRAQEFSPMAGACSTCARLAAAWKRRASAPTRRSKRSTGPKVFAAATSAGGRWRGRACNKIRKEEPSSASMRWSSPRKRGSMTTEMVRNCKTVVMDPGSRSLRSLGRDDEYRYCFIYARPCRSLPRVRLALDRYLGRENVRAQRRRRTAPAAAPRLRAIERDVAPRRAGARAAFHPDPSRPAGLRLVGGAAGERRSRALQQAHHGGGDDRNHGTARARAVSPRRP